MLPYSKLISFNEYKDITPEQYEELLNGPSFDVVPVEKNEDDILSLIFAPDPLTGIPRSDLAVMLSKDTSPEVAQYIHDTLQRPVNVDGPSGTFDADEALDSIKSRNESFSDYAERIRALAQKQYTDNKE